MFFREKLEDLMEKACLSNEQKNTLTDWAIKQVFSGDRHAHVEMTNALKLIVKIIEEHDLKEEFDELMNYEIDFSVEYDDDCALCH